MAVWTLPAENAASWEPGVDIGVTGGIAQYLAGGVNDRAVTGSVINLVTDHSADDTGATDITSALVAACTAASGPTVIYLPAGSFLIEAGYVYSNYKDNITIRGAGESTNVHVSLAGGQVFPFSSPGTFTSNVQTVTGTKTQGSTVLSIADTTGYSVGSHIVVSYENETDDTRIIAGAPMVWSSAGYPFSRGYLAKVTAVVANTSITVDPPLPGDATNLELQTATRPSDSRTSGWGFEDFTVTFDSAAHPATFIAMDAADECWVHNVRFPDWSKETSSGSCVKVTDSYKCEINNIFCHFIGGANSDGVVETVRCSGFLALDNIGSGPMDQYFYESGNSVQSAFAYNYIDQGALIYIHDPHPSLLLFEGNRATYFQSDGYHGSSSQQVLFRNHFDYIALNRMKRKYVLAGNILGRNGVVSGSVSWGNPNIGNSVANGFAGPTGSSDQVGQPDYEQFGYGVNEYIIQSSDVAVGKFWADWNIAGTLTTRTNDYTAVFTVSHGDWFVGGSPTGGNALIPTAHWSGGNTGNSPSNVITNVAGDQVSITFHESVVLPAQDAAVTLYTGAAGMQERDLDVQATSTFAGNYIASVGGSGALTNPISPDTFSASLMYSSDPAFITSAGKTLPVFDSGDYSTSDRTRLPSGARFALLVTPEAPTVGAIIATGTAAEGGSINISGGAVTGEPPPDITFAVKREATTVATSLPYTPVLADVGIELEITKTATNSEGSDSASTFTDEIQPYMGDILVLNQTVNTEPVTELVRRAAVVDGVAGTLADEAILHSGDYPSQPENGYVYAPVRGNGDHVLVWLQADVADQAAAIAARDVLDPL